MNWSISFVFSIISMMMMMMMIKITMIMMMMIFISISEHLLLLEFWFSFRCAGAPPGSLFILLSILSLVIDNVIQIISRPWACDLVCACLLAPIGRKPCVDEGLYNFQYSRSKRIVRTYDFIFSRLLCLASYFITSVFIYVIINK